MRCKPGHPHCFVATTLSLTSDSWRTAALYDFDLPTAVVILSHYTPTYQLNAQTLAQHRFVKVYQQYQVYHQLRRVKAKTSVK